MAFQPGSIANTVTAPRTTGGFVPGSLAEKVTQPTSTSQFTPGTIAGRFGGPATSGGSLRTSEGLYNLATQSGLQSDARRLLARQEGEKTNQFWSGGFMMDTIDTLNVLSYGVNGLLKGQSFLDGIKSRASFTDKDALGDKGIPGLIAGIALDIAFDPLTYIAPASIARKIPFLSKIATAGKEAIFGKVVDKAIEGTSKSYQAVEGGTKLGRYMVEKLSYAAGKDPVFMRIFEQGTKNAAITTQRVVGFGETVAKIDPKDATAILKRDRTGRFIRAPLAEVAQKVPAKALPAIQSLYKEIDDLGRQAVDLGLLSRETWQKNEGEYIKNAYEEYQKKANKSPFGFAKNTIRGIKSRKDVENVSEFGLTQIDNPAYLLMKSAIDLTRDVENAKMLKAVSERFGSDVAQDGFTKIADDPKRWGALSGKHVPSYMQEYLSDMVKPAEDTIGRKLIGNFKFAKVVMNPATHVRNIMSNEILNYWKLGMNPLDPRTLKAKGTAIAEIAKGGGKWSDEARTLGYDLDTFASQELRSILDSPEMSNAMTGAGKAWNTIKKKLGDIYQMEENQAKLTAYIYQRTVKNLEPEAAWKAAESATFNYAQVSPLVRKLRTSIWGMPFITFTAKATPLALETAAKNPGRISVIGKLKKGIENASDINETDRERASEPPWVKDGFYIKLPMKDSYGRSAYLDLTYILPFGDLMSGSFFERGLSTETGTPESVGQAIIKKNPVVQLVSEIAKNRNFYGNKIWLESDSQEKQNRDILLHILKTWSPPAVGDAMPNGYNAKTGERDWAGFAGTSEAAQDNQKRTFMEELMRNFGVKIQPFNADVQEQFTEWNKRRALETLLKENGVTKSFEQVYVPK